MRLTPRLTVWSSLGTHDRFGGEGCRAADETALDAGSAVRLHQRVPGALASEPEAPHDIQPPSEPEAQSRKLYAHASHGQREHSDRPA